MCNEIIALGIENRIALLKSRSKYNAPIVRKLERKLRKLKSAGMTE